MQKPTAKTKIILVLITLCLIAAAIVAVAVSTKSYKVTFLSDGAVYKEITVKSVETMTLPEEPTKEYYTFDGWFYSNNASLAFDASKKVTANISVTAKWTENYTENHTDGLLFTPIEGGYKVSVGTTADETEIVIPRIYNGKQVIEIDDSFAACTSLVKLTVPFVGANSDGANAYLGYIFGAGNDHDLRVPVSLKEVIVTDGTSIGANAFYGCSGLTSVTLDTVTTIGRMAFAYCDGLISVSILSVTRIEDYAFWFCAKVTSVTIPVDVTFVGYAAFYNWTNEQTIYIEGRTSIPVEWDSQWNLTCRAIVTFI